MEICKTGSGSFSISKMKRTVMICASWNNKRTRYSNRLDCDDDVIEHGKLSRIFPFDYKENIQVREWEKREVKET
ncbi:hypothetical protein TNCV_3164101 [Trichonephila clavipes]|nr:hypothetical protein TNCV_3164101 [Trichonephila clavipes]